MRRDVFQAIADPSRRAIIGLLAEREKMTVNSVAERFKISRPAVSKHLKILTECGLVVTSQEGREKYCEVTLRQLGEVSEWMEQYRRFWEHSFDALDGYLKELQVKEKGHGVKRKDAGNELVLERVFDAPIGLVWKAWTEADHLMAWWGPKHHPATEMTIDLTVGGRWRACLRAVADGKLLWMNGVIREIVPQEKLVFTFRWEEDGERGLETVITVVFTEKNGSTHMVFRQVPFQSNAERDGHTEGWSSCFERLEESALLRLPAGSAAVR